MSDEMGEAEMRELAKETQGSRHALQVLKCVRCGRPSFASVMRRAPATCGRLACMVANGEMKAVEAP